jgi:sugar-specific transcriptional regulator TrmB
MQIENRLRNHYRRWNIVLDSEEEFSKFKNRLIEIIDRNIGDYLADNLDVDRRFKETFDLNNANRPSVRKSQPIYKEGHPMNPSLLADTFKTLQPDSYTKRGFGDTHIYRSIIDCENFNKLVTVLQIIFWSLEIKHDEIKEALSKIVKEIKRISVLTPSANFTVYKRGKQFIVYPSGDQFLDAGIIDCTLSGLENYPKVAESFEKALRIYLSGETSQYRNLLDNLRFSLEQLLKKVLNNQKSLENQKNYLLPWLKDKGLHSQVVNLYEKFLGTYQDYQNNAVKHDEAFSFDEVEFMIYLTGSFMRLVLQLVNNDNNQRK